MNQSTNNVTLEQQLNSLIGRRLASLRHRAGLQLEELAIRSGLPSEELMDHEQGTLPLPLSRVPILCEVLGCRMHKLVRTARQGHDRLKKRAAEATCRNS